MPQLVSARLSDKTADRVKQYARKKQRSVNETVSIALEEWLRQNEFAFWSELKNHTQLPQPNAHLKTLLHERNACSSPGHFFSALPDILNEHGICHDADELLLYDSNS